MQVRIDRSPTLSTSRGPNVNLAHSYRNEFEFSFTTTAAMAVIALCLSDLGRIERALDL